MTTAYEATIWVQTDLCVDKGYDEADVEKLMHEHDIKETCNYGEFLNVKVNLNDGDSFKDVAENVEGIFAPLVAAQKAQSVGSL